MAAAAAGGGGSHLLKSSAKVRRAAYVAPSCQIFQNEHQGTLIHRAAHRKPKSPFVQFRKPVARSRRR